MTTIHHNDLSKPIYDRVKKMIMSGELVQGEKIIQEKIAAQLGVSRTPLQKALQLLENEFLVESIPRRGVYVRKIDFKEMIDVYYCREAIEGMAARLLAKAADPAVVKQLRACFDPFIGKDDINVTKYSSADEKFHKLIVGQTENKPLDKIYFFGNIYGQVVSMGLVRGPKETIDEHIKIIDSIASGDQDSAEKFARQHIEKSRVLLEKEYQKQRENSIT